MKTIICALLICCGHCFSQQKYLTKSGMVSFEASVPSFEAVAATNNSVTAIMNMDTGEIAALALIKGFRFKNALMEEHFNENYAESFKYPKATFKGKIDDFSSEKVTTSKNEFKLTGELNFHGVTKPLRDCVFYAYKKDASIVIEGSFEALASDFEIEIPSIVRNKIAENIHVTFHFELMN